jgi:hypothetical protein
MIVNPLHLEPSNVDFSTALGVSVTKCDVGNRRRTPFLASTSTQRQRGNKAVAAHGVHPSDLMVAGNVGSGQNRRIVGLASLNHVD